MDSIRIAMALAVVLLMATVAPAAADTIGGPEGDRLVASTTFGDTSPAGDYVSTSVTLIDDRLADTVTIEVGQSSTTQVTCPGPDRLTLPMTTPPSRTDTSTRADLHQRPALPRGLLPGRGTAP